MKSIKNHNIVNALALSWRCNHVHAITEASNFFLMLLDNCKQFLLYDGQFLKSLFSSNFTYD